MVTVHIDPARMEDFARRVQAYRASVTRYRDTYREPGKCTRAEHLDFPRRMRELLNEMHEVRHFWQVELSDDEKALENMNHERDIFHQAKRIAKKITYQYICIMANQPNSPIQYDPGVCENVTNGGGGRRGQTRRGRRRNRRQTRRRGQSRRREA